MSWREYHDSTKHTAEALRRWRHVLDWANMPNPFRHYEGVPLLDLDGSPPPLLTPALDVLHGRSGAPDTTNGPALLSQLLFHSAAVSASKLVPSTGSRYALRVNPSSGNLHPTEFHFSTRGLADWPDALYHYRPSSHMAEQRALRNEISAANSLTFLLTSIAWRESWKYRDRAYRYCLLDIGHAWEALSLAARAAGLQTFARGSFNDDDLSRSLRLSDDEWPLLIIDVNTAAISPREPDAGAIDWFDGIPNALSEERIEYPSIHRIHALTKLIGAATPQLYAAPLESSGLIPLPPPSGSQRPFDEVARTRRSALDFQGGHRSMSLADLSAVLHAAAEPLRADFGGDPFVHLYLYAHRVDGLPPGVYRHLPNRAALASLQPGDQRVIAAALSLNQDLAGNACVAFSMVADLDRATRLHGDRGYRYAHFEAGAIGQRLYLAAEALGFRGTGIGAFFDDEVHRYLRIAPEQGQVIYHFAIGYPVPDPRLDS